MTSSRDTSNKVIPANAASDEITADRIRRAQEAMGLSDEGLSGRLGVDRGDLYELVTGWVPELTGVARMDLKRHRTPDWGMPS